MWLVLLRILQPLPLLTGCILFKVGPISAKHTCNARLSGKQLRKFCPLSPAQQDMLLNAVEQFGLSARAFDRILRVARTIADLAGREYPSDNDLFEAIQFRQFETHLRS